MFQKIIDHFNGKRFSKVGELNYEGGRLVAFESRGRQVIANYAIIKKGGLRLAGFTRIGA